MENVVRVFSTLALMGAVRSLAGPYQAGGGARIDADFAPTVGLLERLRQGEAADIVILTQEALRDLAAKGTVAPESCVDLARSFVGIAVKAGAVRPISPPRPPCARRARPRARWPIRAPAPAAFSLPP